MRELSIAMVCFPTFGGSGVIARELAVGLAERSHRVHLIASAPPSRPLPVHERLYFHRATASDYPLFEQPPYEIAIASKLVEVAEQHRPDLIQVHYAVPHSASAYLARQVLGDAAPRIITTLHGTDVTRVGLEPSVLPVARFTIAASDGITVPSAFLEGAARELLGAQWQKPIEVIPNFVDVDRFAPLPGRELNQKPILIHVSNFRPVKRVLDLLDVLLAVRKRLPEARLVLVGDGPDRRAAESRAEELGIASAVTFLGARSEFSAELAQADLFLLPSEIESFGLAALEAASAGVPVVGYRVGGLPELVEEGETGRLVEPFDREALADAALELLSNPERWRRYARAARERVVASFSREPALDRYEAYFARVLRGER